MFKLIALLSMIALIIQFDKPGQLEAKKFGHMIFNDYHSCKCKEHWGHWDDHWSHWGSHWNEHMTCKCMKKKKLGFFKKLKKKIKKKKKFIPIVTIPGECSINKPRHLFDR